MSRLTDRKVDMILHVLLAVFYGLTFRILLQSGLSADDMWNSNVWAYPYTGEGSIWQDISSQFNLWLHVGRFFPISNLAPCVYALCTNILTYKLAILIAVYLDNLVCWLLMYRLTDSRWMAYLYMLIFPVLIQLTPEFDSGLYCYHLLIQTVVLFGLLAIYGWVRYLDTGLRRYLMVSAVSMLLALCTYEVGFVFVIPFGYLGYKKLKNGKQILFRGLPVWCVILAVGLWNVIIRILFKEASYGGIEVTWDLRKIWITFCKQCSTCIPLGRYIGSYYADGFFTDQYTYSWKALAGMITLPDLAAVLCFLALYLGILLGNKKENGDIDNGKTHAGEHGKRTMDSAMIRMIAILGGMIWLLPGVLIAISDKYQNSLGWFAGHLPAYMQSLGFTMVVTALIVAWADRISNPHVYKLGAGILGGILAIILLLDQVTAREILEYMNGYRKYPQENIACASREGFFDAFEDREDMVLVGTTHYIYDAGDCRSFYSKLAGRNLYAEDLITYGEHMRSETLEDPAMVGEDGKSKKYYGIFNMADRESGAMILGECVGLEWDAEGSRIEHLWVQDPVIYIRGNGIQLSGVDPSEWELMTAADDSSIYTLQGEVDLIQAPVYYESEVNAGVLYYESPARTD